MTIKQKIIENFKEYKPEFMTLKELEDNYMDKARRAYRKGKMCDCIKCSGKGFTERVIKKALTFKLGMN